MGKRFLEDNVVFIALLRWKPFVKSMSKLLPRIELKKRTSERTFLTAVISLANCSKPFNADL
jgi:hypothetical protein